MVKVAKEQDTREADNALKREMAVEVKQMEEVKKPV